MVKYMHGEGLRAPDVSDCARADQNLFFRVLGLVLVFIPLLAAGQPGYKWHSFELEMVTDSSLCCLLFHWAYGSVYF